MDKQTHTNSQQIGQNILYNGRMDGQTHKKAKYHNKLDRIYY